MLETTTDEARGPQILYSLARVSDGFLATLKRRLEGARGIDRTVRKEVTNGPEPKHEALKALQQRIVQLPGDAGSLANAFGETNLELLRHPAKVATISRPQSDKHDPRRGCSEPPGCPPRWLDRDLNEFPGLAPRPA